MGYSRLKQIVENSYRDGQSWYSSFRKVPAITTVQGVWTDLSLAPGNPKPNYYATAQYTAAVLDYRFGIYHGGAVSPKTKHLHKLLIGSVNAGVAPATFILCDYLLYYPLIDMDNTEEQTLINTVSLPRYTDGVGVKAFIVATNPYAGGQTFTINYTNSNGVAGRTSKSMMSNSNTNIGTIITSGTVAGTLGPFIELQFGDTGIRSIQSVTFYGSNGGLAAIVLCKPIATVLNRETTAFSETDFLVDIPSLPRIYDGAYLNMLCLPNGSAAGQLITGDMTVIWN